MKTIIELREEAIKQDKNIEFYLYQLLEEQDKEIERLHSIIKEAREYIEEDIKGNYFKRYDDEVYKLCDELLEILERANNDK